MSKGSSMAVLLALLVASQARAQPAGPAVVVENLPTFEAKLESAEIALARPFQLRLIGRHRVGTSVSWASPLLLGPGLEEQARELRPLLRQRNVLTSELIVTLMAFETEIRRVPPIEMRYDDGTGTQRRHYSEAMPLSVRGIADLTQAQLRPIRGPVDVKVRDWRFIRIAAGSLALSLFLLAMWLLWRRRLRSLRAVRLVSGPRLSAHVEALQKLDALEASGALDEDELKDAFLEMSEILRFYLGRRYKFSALDLTTSEIRSRLASVPDSHQWLSSLTSWLSNCDLVKYASAPATQDEARESLYAARILIDRTKDIPQDRPREVARA